MEIYETITPKPLVWVTFLRETAMVIRIRKIKTHTADNDNKKTNFAKERRMRMSGITNLVYRGSGKAHTACPELGNR